MPKRVRLKGRRLERSNRHLTAATDYVYSIAEIVAKELQLETGADEIAMIQIYPGNTRAVIYSDEGLCLGVYENPPGICRECGAAEGVLQA